MPRESADTPRNDPKLITISYIASPDAGAEEPMRVRWPGSSEVDTGQSP
jgi:hypothetical protein